MALDKVRIRFRKEGDLRLVSHHDLMRSFERMLRRASLPFRSTSGFHPTPRLVFASSLPLGVIGLAEVVEIELTEEVAPDEILTRLRQQAPLGITFLSAKRVELRQTARAQRAVYHLSIGARARGEGADDAAPAPRRAPICQDLDERCRQLLTLPVLWVERDKPRPRRMNIRPFIKSLICLPEALELDLWITPEGTARADEVVRALGLAPLLEQGHVLERTFLEILDEIDPTEAAQRPILPDRRIPNELEVSLEGPTAITHVPSIHWGASPNGPVVE